MRGGCGRTHRTQCIRAQDRNPAKEPENTVRYRTFGGAPPHEAFFREEDSWQVRGGTRSREEAQIKHEGRFAQEHHMEGCARAAAPR